MLVGLMIKSRCCMYEPGTWLISIHCLGFHAIYFKLAFHDYIFTDYWFMPTDGIGPYINLLLLIESIKYTLHIHAILFHKASRYCNYEWNISSFISASELILASFMHLKNNISKKDDSIVYVWERERKREENSLYASKIGKYYKRWGSSALSICFRKKFCLCLSHPLSNFKETAYNYLFLSFGE